LFVFSKVSQKVVDRVGQLFTWRSISYNSYQLIIISWFSVLICTILAVVVDIAVKYSNACLVCDDRINNCVGEINQKFFIQFLLYVGKWSYIFL